MRRQLLPAPRVALVYSDSTRYTVQVPGPTTHPVGAEGTVADHLELRVTCETLDTRLFQHVCKPRPTSRATATLKSPPIASIALRRLHQGALVRGCGFWQHRFH